MLNKDRTMEKMKIQKAVRDKHKSTYLADERKINRKSYGYVVPLSIN